MFAKLAVSVAVGFLGAYPLASSSGLMGTVREYQQDSIIIASGMILFFLTLALSGPTLRLIRQVLETLSRVEERPRPPIAWTMLILGVTCAISSMVIALNASNGPPVGLSMNLPGFNAGTQVVSQPSGSFVLGLLTILTFVLGAALIGLGIWASLKPGPKRIGETIKPAAREFEEVAS